MVVIISHGEAILLQDVTNCTDLTYWSKKIRQIVLKNID